MMLFRSFFGLVVVTVLLQCSCSSCGDENTVRSSKLIITATDTSFKNGRAKTFYQDGSIQDEIDFVASRKHGSHVHYRDNGTVEYREKYRDGQLNGKALRFHVNGQVELETTWVDGKQFGRSVRYNSEGGVIDIVFYDFYGKSFCKADYTLPNAPPSLSWLVVSPNIWSYPRLDTILLGDTVMVQIATAQIAGMHTEVRCYLDDRELALHSFDSSMVSVRVVPTKRGSQELLVRGIITDERGSVRLTNEIKERVVVPAEQAPTGRSVRGAF